MKLLVVGAGPKAMAIAAKAQALEFCGYKVPQVIILEKSGAAANWTGGFGYTDGQQSLGTPPEKDVGFPYSSDLYDSSNVARYMQANFSWQAYQVLGAHSYGDWIDRGRNHPLHGEWAEYLNWVLDATDCQIVRGDVKRITPKGELWKVEYDSPETGKIESQEVDGIVLTGPGPAKLLPNAVPEHERILDGANFWQSLTRFGHLEEDDEPLIVIGSGETAAAVVVQLIQLRRGREVPILIVNRHGTIFSRGEGYFENRIFTDPGLWANLEIEERRRIIERADRGVISVAAHRSIGTAKDIYHVTVDVKGIDIERDFASTDPDGPNVERLYVLGTKGESIAGQYIIVAIGFDAWWWTQWLPDNFRGNFSDDDFRRKAEEEITEDLAIPEKFLKPKLHVPMLSGIAQGPGYPNLSCLGHLSDYILGPYVKALS